MPLHPSWFMVNLFHRSGGKLDHEKEEYWGIVSHGGSNSAGCLAVFARTQCLHGIPTGLCLKSISNCVMNIL